MYGYKQQSEYEGTEDCKILHVTSCQLYLSFGLYVMHIDFINIS